MKRLLILLLVCAVAAAMIPRIRRAEPKTSSIETTTPKYCAKTTPCAWSIYSSQTKEIEMNLTNDYCICEEPLLCLIYLDDTSANTYILRCLPEGS